MSVYKSLRIYLEGAVGDVANEILHRNLSNPVRVPAEPQEASVVHRVGVVRGVGEHGAEAHGLATRDGMMVVSECASEAGGSNSGDEQTTHAGEGNGRETSGSKKWQ